MQTKLEVTFTVSYEEYIALQSILAIISSNKWDDCNDGQKENLIKEAKKLVNDMTNIEVEL
jgi:hypothetical protein